MSSERRTLRLGEMLREAIVELLLREVKDPRIGMVTISAVRLSADLSHAKIYVHCIGDAQAQERCLRGLRSAGGFLRTKLGQTLHLRKVPVLDFRLDPSFEPLDPSPRQAGGKPPAGGF